MAGITVLEADFLTANEGNTTMIAVPFSIETPSSDQGIANKAYVDSRAYGTYRTASGALNFGISGSAFASSVGFPVHYQITGMGNYVTLQLAPIPLTAATTTVNVMKGSAIPAAYLPTQTVTRPCSIYTTATATTIGEVSVDAAGVVYITCPLLSSQFGTFTSGVPAGVPGISITYLQT